METRIRTAVETHVKGSVALWKAISESSVVNGSWSLDAIQDVSDILDSMDREHVRTAKQYVSRCRYAYRNRLPITSTLREIRDAAQEKSKRAQAEREKEAEIQALITQRKQHERLQEFGVAIGVILAKFPEAYGYLYAHIDTQNVSLTQGFQRVYKQLDSLPVPEVTLSREVIEATTESVAAAVAAAVEAAAKEKRKAKAKAKAKAAA